MAAPLLILIVVMIAGSLALMVIGSVAKNYLLVKIVAGVAAFGALLYFAMLMTSSFQS